jgi:polyisoprenoid-binding protein YceI
VRRFALLILLTTAVLAATACTPSPSEVPVEPTAPAAPSLPADTPPEPAETSASPTGSSGGQVIFRIVPEQSEARFLIDEILAGSPKTVVGVTSDVTGEITGDVASPQSVAVGPIQVDMSSLRTDNNFRNRALHDAILQTGNEANRFATFLVTSIEGLPAEVAFGTPYNLSLAGDLTIHGVTRPVTFEAVVTPVSETRLEGTASVSLPYRDFDVQILRLPPQVASVGDVVTLEIDFVAEPS